MKLAYLGRYIRTNSVTFDDKYVTKRFRQVLRYYPQMLCGTKERKPYQPPEKRYMRDSRVSMRLCSQGLNVPEIVDYSDDELWFRFVKLDIDSRKDDLIAVFEDPALTFDEKLQYYREALELLKAIHTAGETHGDTYPKNFFRLRGEDRNRDGRVYTCDFEFERDSPLPEVTDIMILTGDSISIIRNGHPEEYVTFNILNIVSDVFGSLPSYPFDERDIAFFERRFGTDQRFFDYFS